MKGFPFRIVLVCACILLQGVSSLVAQPRARAQTAVTQTQRDSLAWEQILQHYQSFCDGAVAAKAGDKAAAKGLRLQADTIAELLKKVKGSGMTPSQQLRFAQMKQRYAGVVTLPELPAAPAPAVIQVVSGQTTIIRDTVMVVREVHQTDTVRIVEQVEKIVEVPVERVVEVPVEVPVAIPAQKPETHYLLMAQAIVPDFSYGLMAGATRKAGLYVRFDSNFCFQKADYTCSSDGQASYGQIWTTGRSLRSRLSATGGALWHPLPWLTAYAGAGYGERRLYWEDISNRWARVSDASSIGVAADLGVIFHIDHFSLSAGVTTLAFRRLDGCLGLGVFF